MNKIVLIVGNGFDLDLGWKTSYSDFASNDKFWPFKYAEDSSNSLSGYLNNHKEIDTWFDMESCLGEYAKLDADRPVDKVLLTEDKRDYDALVNKLKQYLEKEQDKELNKDSFAYNILNQFRRTTMRPCVYSFNYTDPFRQLHGNIDVNYMHGSLKDDNIILGMDGNSKIKEGYTFLRKTYNPKYRANNIKEDLKVANIIFIFGLSFGLLDYEYFKEYFMSLKYPSGNKTNRCWIITKDNGSRYKLLENIREMCGDMDTLNQNNDFNVICKDSSRDLINRMLRDLEV